jgi:hypothetical protein
VIFGEGEGEASGFFGMKSSMCFVFMCFKHGLILASARLRM